MNKRLCNLQLLSVLLCAGVETTKEINDGNVKVTWAGNPEGLTVTEEAYDCLTDAIQAETPAEEAQEEQLQS